MQIPFSISHIHQILNFNIYVFYLIQLQFSYKRDYLEYKTKIVKENEKAAGKPFKLSSQQVIYGNLWIQM